jgi:ribonuclease HII
MKNSLKELKKVKENNSKILLDGGLKAPIQYKDQKTIIKGDEKFVIIALASIVAKVERDRKMVKLSKKYPQYGFEKHMGYGTKFHLVKIKELGITKYHRKSFIHE